MKPHYLTVTPGNTRSLSARRDAAPDVNNHWHYHDELELIFIKKGSGTQFVGDSIHHFSEGSLALIGSNLPHYWQFDDSYFDGSEHAVEVFVIHFREDFLGADFFSQPENTNIKRLLAESVRGIRLDEKSSASIGQLIINAVNNNNTLRFAYLLEALLTMAESDKKQLLASVGFNANVPKAEKDRLQDVYNFSISQYKQKIGLDEAAKVARLTESAFCKFFKSKTGKTYTLFLNEIRVGQACRMLVENRLSVKEICFECGFFNAASFHKCFRQITGTTPLRYQKKFVRIPN